MRHLTGPSRTTLANLLLLLCAGSLLSACGGGGGGAETVPTPPIDSGPPVSPPPPPPPPPPASDAQITEFHYQNVGQDEGEFIEVRVVTGADVSSIQVAPS
ncbi:MAG: hypothetical protein AAFY82_07155 [Pseudomonadota bacterium]